MHRRSVLLGSLALLASRNVRALAASDGGTPARRTRWAVRSSEGLDAISFLGPLSGRSLYTEHYTKELAAFAPRLPADVHSDLAKQPRVEVYCRPTSVKPEKFDFEDSEVAEFSTESTDSCGKCERSRA